MYLDSRLEIEKLTSERKKAASELLQEVPKGRLECIAKHSVVFVDCDTHLRDLFGAEFVSGEKFSAIHLRITKQFHSD